MARALPFLLQLALFVYCLVDLVRSPDDDIRNLPKWGWLLIIILLPLLGSIAWLIAGRPRYARVGLWPPTAGPPPDAALPSPSPSPVADIDARLEAELAHVDEEFEELLRRRREETADDDEPPR